MFLLDTLSVQGVPLPLQNTPVWDEAPLANWHTSMKSFPLRSKWLRCCSPNIHMTNDVDSKNEKGVPTCIIWCTKVRNEPKSGIWPRNIASDNGTPLLTYRITKAVGPRHIRTPAIPLWEPIRLKDKPQLKALLYLQTTLLPFPDFLIIPISFNSWFCFKSLGPGTWNPCQLVSRYSLAPLKLRHQPRLWCEIWLATCNGFGYENELPKQGNHILQRRFLGFLPGPKLSCGLALLFAFIDASLIGYFRCSTPIGFMAREPQRAQQDIWSIFVSSDCLKPGQSIQLQHGWIERNKSLCFACTSLGESTQALGLAVQLANFIFQEKNSVRLSGFNEWKNQ